MKSVQYIGLLWIIISAQLLAEDIDESTICNQGTVSLNATDTFDGVGEGSQDRLVGITVSIPLGSNCAQVARDQSKAASIRRELMLLENCKKYMRLELDPYYFPEFASACKGIRRK